MDVSGSRNFVWTLGDSAGVSSAQLTKELNVGCLRRRVAERRQNLAPGERVPIHRDNPGTTSRENPEPAKRGQVMRLAMRDLMRPYRARKFLRN